MTTRLGAGALALGLAVGTAQQAVASPANTAAPAALAGPAATTDQAGNTTVTLITGDQVVLGPNGARSVRPGPGREHIAFTTQQLNGHLHVVPVDAAPLVASGKLDPRLFDITQLIEFGYDDAHRDTLPLIIKHPTGQARASLAVQGTAVTQDLPSINGTAVATGKANATALWEAVTAPAGSVRSTAAGVDTVWLDGKRQASLDRSVAQIGAPTAWEAGYTGDGVTVAVLDSGVDQTHPDLTTQEIGEKNFTDTESAVDNFGHGTHVASIIAGTGAKSGGKYRGVAPGAKLLDGKVLDDNGYGQESWILAAMQWAAESGAKIANLSLGGLDTPEVDPLEEAVNTLSEQYGILFAIAAGNSGPNTETVGSPGSADAALTVGAVDRDESLAPFSSRGPRVNDGAIKPDITAPGVDIVAARHSAGTIGAPVEDGYVALSGTSMATPHVAGSAALLAQLHPDWTGARLKAALVGSAKPNPTLSVFEQGAGRVDVAKAITQTLTSTPGIVSLGVARWPHHDDQPITHSVTYHNSGTTDLTLNLALSVTGPDGQPAPAGLFTVTPTQLTVPAGGSAETTITADTTRGSVDGVYTGALVAGAGGTEAVRTPLAVNREVESYDLTVHYTGPDGQPAWSASSTLLNLATAKATSASAVAGTATVRVPRGDYALDNNVFTLTGENQYRYAWLPQPKFSVTGDATLEVDARQAKPSTITPPDPAARFALGDFSLTVRTAVGRYSFGWVLQRGDGLGILSTTQLGPETPAEGTSAWIGTQWASPTGAATFYDLTWPLPRVPTGFTAEVRTDELAEVRSELNGPAGQRGQWGLISTGPNGAGGWVALSDVSLPTTATDFVTTDEVSWSGLLDQLTSETDPGGFPVVEAEFVSPARTYRAGERFTERFNRGPFGPGAPNDQRIGGVFRVGDVLYPALPLFTDSAGNYGNSTVDKARTVLSLGGEVIGETNLPGRGQFTVPAAQGRYTLETTAERGTRFDVSSTVSATWTFTSGHADGPDPVAVPISAVRFTPTLDAANTAPAGVRFDVPVSVQGTARLRTVEVSYDDGATWKRVPVVHGTAKLVHPAKAGFVSLRATASGRDNGVEQTIIRAYKIA
ncbi:S8 family peptidase [Goodfellowiella coeruleoviolacea]|uniref:S8 family peptidase n=1 Tax=Goodfellowiella coeruleoviolacea TaxID=334858 RepID=UPI000AF2C978|nr:S8 family peptidase [Goodfellowiella coeruleoviolacea]